MSARAVGPADPPSGVGRRLLEFADQLSAAGSVQVGDAFTDDPRADALIRRDANAFLLGVLFTQGVPAERAWAGPYLLRERLGHLDLARLKSEREAVAVAVAARPALHRFKNTVAGWVSDVAAMLVDDWGGDARNLWSDRPAASELRRRLEVFPGIGPKKAAMAVELLSRCMGVQVSEPSGGSVAYDVHVRRVFLRSGLVEHDRPSEVEAAARRVCPEAPGSLDLAAWTIGRRWCRPVGADCASCWLGEVCPRHTDRVVAGVGVRTRKALAGR